MIIDSTGTCGVTGPTASADADQTFYNHWVAVNDFSDPPATLEDDDAAPASTPAANLVWVEKQNSYCSGNNMAPAVMETDYARHSCYTKCVLGAPCDNSDGDCFCDGLYPGYDTEDSTALCLNLDSCKAACLAEPNCFGFDMHSTLDRCFLNIKSDETGGCADQVQRSSLATIDTYSFWFKHPHVNTRRLERRDRRLLAVVDTGNSWSQMLRFSDITFTTGGTFTACFCDSEVDANHHSLQVCAKPEDYKVAVGTVHVSGVECLLQESKFRRGSCVAHHWHPTSSLRCYEGDLPVYEYPTPSPTPAPTIPDQTQQTSTSHLSSYCLYGPEEETRDNPLCQWPTQ